MTQEHAKKILPFVQAVAEGATLQFRSEDDHTWRDSPNLLFTAPIECYRIKPEPREWNMWVTQKGELTTNSDMQIREIIRVREIFPEPTP